MTLVGKVDGTHGHLALILCIHTVGIPWEAVADALAIVATHTDAQTGNGVVVNAQGHTILVGHLKLQW